MRCNGVRESDYWDFERREVGAVFFTARTNAQKNNSKMKKNLNEKAVRLELVTVNQCRFSAEVLSGNARVNLTQMAQPFGKSCKPTFWLRTEEAQRYLKAIARLQKCNLADLIEVRNGGVPGTNGTWCRDYRIALRFAQWLSPEFSIKVDEAILGLLAAPGGAQRAQAPRVVPEANGALGRLPIPRERSAELGEFYSELRKWVLKEDEAAVAELAGVSRGHVAEVLAGRKAGYGVLCLLVEYATENRAAGRQRMVRSAARRAEQVEELRLDFMCGVAPLRMGSTAREPQNRANRVAPEPPAAVGCDRGATGASGGVALLRKGASADKLPSSGDAMNRVSTAKAQDVTNGVIDFNGMEG